jgi:hypothetical protein
MFSSLQLMRHRLVDVTGLVVNELWIAFIIQPATGHLFRTRGLVSTTKLHKVAASFRNQGWGSVFAPQIRAEASIATHATHDQCPSALSNQHEFINRQAG